jgi:hypothetical protein
MLTFAGSWSGFLVDAECYSATQANTKGGTHPASIDNNRTLRVCAPKATTKSFAVMQEDGTSFELDSAGNQKARDFVAKQGNVPRYKVNVTGDMTQNTLQLSTISMAQ